MSGGRSEQPTPRRLREARRRGEAAGSRDLVGAAAFAGGLAALAATAPDLAGRMARHLRASLQGALSGEPAPLAAVASSLAALSEGAGPVLLGALAGGAGAGLLATGCLFAPRAAAPRLARVDPAAGLRRLASPERLADGLLSLLRGAACAAAGAVFLRSVAPSLAGLPRLAPGALLRALPALLAPLASGLAALLVGLGLLDLLLARRRHLRSLRMTREEVLREHREEEGDPRQRSERREAHRALSAAGPVAEAAVLVVNPTRLAVALAHRRGSDEPPVVLAKGAGGEAARLRREARRAGVPVVRDVALARSLFRLAGVGEAIPEELYQAAAALLVQVHGLSRELLP